MYVVLITAQHTTKYFIPIKSLRLVPCNSKSINILRPAKFTDGEISDTAANACF